MSKLTAKSFRDPILKAMGSITSLRSGVTVSMEAVYRPVMDILGIEDENVYGNYPATGQPHVHKWVQWEYISLVRAGLCGRKQRGLWFLTPAGVDEASRLKDWTVSRAPLPSEAVLAHTVVTPPTESEVELAASSLQVLFVDPSYVPADTYETDSYIRSLAIKKSSCFGSWTNKANAICTTCPLALSCRNSYFGTLSRLASTLQAEDIAALAPPAPVPAPVPAPAPKVKTGAAEATSKTKFNLALAPLIVVVAQSACVSCDSNINAGEMAYWVESTDDGAGVLLHEHHKDES